MAAPSTQAVAPVTMGPLNHIIARLKESFSGVVKQQKPWVEMADRTAFSKPNNLNEAYTRVSKNWTYFRMNYIIVMMATCAFTFAMHPGSLIMMALLIAAWLYIIVIRQAPLVIGGRTLSHYEKIYGMAAVSFITVFFLTNVGTVLFSAVSISTALVALHAAMRQPDDLFLDDTQATPGLFNFFAVPSSSPAVAVNV